MPRIQYLQNSSVENVLQTETTGEGIKKTPAYETPLSEKEKMQTPISKSFLSNQSNFHLATSKKSNMTSDASSICTNFIYLFALILIV